MVSVKPLNFNPTLVQGLAGGLHLHSVRHMSVKKVWLTVKTLCIVGLKKNLGLATLYSAHMLGMCSGHPSQVPQQ